MQRLGLLVGPLFLRGIIGAGFEGDYCERSAFSAGFGGGAIVKGLVLMLVWSAWRGARMRDTFS